jgi:hypothetical protein
MITKAATVLLAVPNYQQNVQKISCYFCNMCFSRQQLVKENKFLMLWLILPEFKLGHKTPIMNGDDFELR